MKKAKENLYEGMYIFNAGLNEKDREKFLAKIKDGITGKGGKIHKVHEMGKKKLAYEIKGKQEGFYYLLYFSLNSQEILPLWREYFLDENILRFVTLRTESVKDKLEFKSLKLS